ncbi:MAG: hypothetical protein ABIH26_03645 [Candidatus Eisenbacteria bacterium]
MSPIPVLVVVLLSLIFAPEARASSDSLHTSTAGASAVSERTAVSGQWFLAFRAGRAEGEDFSGFSVDRGYIIIRHRLSERLTGRITPDVSVDREGDGEGDLEMRLKYCFVDWTLDDLGFLSEPHVEFGLVHRPWLEFEEHVNTYRVQGPMFLERAGVINSADFGFTFFAEIGDLPGEKHGMHATAAREGRYGSLAAGMYNGGGYHAIEKNNNKTIEGRLTVRPLPSVLPGLRFSYHGILGKGNTAAGPDWRMNLFYVSLEHRRGVLAGQLYSGKGDFRGNAVGADGEACERSGASLFGELRSGSGLWSAIARYDFFENRPDDAAEEERTLITGLARRVGACARILLDFEALAMGDRSDAEEKTGGFRVEFKF